jgi:hypothetical protein
MKVKLWVKISDPQEQWHISPGFEPSTSHFCYKNAAPELLCIEVIENDINIELNKPGPNSYVELQEAHF